ncbi:MAG: helix-turn-helix domain-containing protein [Lachnospiraceae bacterium]|nr:helix-turn-helix domain-containing protein [Lachnospiraceae bacterium]
MDTDELGLTIRTYRKKKGLTQRELGDLLGISDKMVSRWENGLSIPDAVMYLDICRELEIPSADEVGSGRVSPRRSIHTGRRLWITLLVIVCLITATVITSALIRYLAFRAADDKADPIIYRGRSAYIRESEIKSGYDLYRLSGMTEQEALSSSVAYFKELNSLYALAKRKGYTVSDREVKKHLSDLKDSIKKGNADREMSREFEIAVSSSGSEDKYWDQAFKSYKKIIPVEKMNADIERKYLRNNSMSDGEDFNTYYQEFKNKLVRSEHYKKIRPISFLKNK